MGSFINSFIRGSKKPMILTVDTTKVGTTLSNQMLLPIYGTDMRVVTTEQDLTVSAPVTLEWLSDGVYQIAIYGLDYIRFNNVDDNFKLTSIDAWGSNEFTSMYNAFSGCANMVGNFTDMPDLSNVTDMSLIFAYCSIFNSNINDWDISNVTNIALVFALCYQFNQPLYNWDVGNVIDMHSLFNKCYVFNQDISSWNISNVQNINYLFYYAYDFNQDISSWNVSNVITMNQTFREAHSFNKNISNWNVDNVTDMGWMFFNAISFNQNISAWNVSSVSEFTSFMYNVTLDTSYYDNILIAWELLDLVDGLSIDFGNSKYSTVGEIAKNAIIADDSWTFTDGGLE